MGKQQEFWEEARPYVLVGLFLLLLFMGGMLWRITHGRAAFPKESERDRQNRLVRCAEFHRTSPTSGQRIDGDDAGVCSGFSEDEIEDAKSQ